MMDDKISPSSEFQILDDEHSPDKSVSSDYSISPFKSALLGLSFGAIGVILPIIFPFSSNTAREQDKPVKSLEEKSFRVEYVRPSEDLNGDGVEDLVLTYRDGSNEPMFGIREKGKTVFYTKDYMSKYWVGNPPVDYKVLEERLNKENQ